MTSPNNYTRDPVAFYFGWNIPVADPGEKPGRRARCLEWVSSTLEREAALAGEPLKLRSGVDQMIAEIGQGNPASNPSLHPGLQDLGDQIAWETSRACKAFDDPDIWYPGDHGDIEPVTDDHVRLVIWAMQRELNRELRPLGMPAALRRPAAPLADLPWRIQRALVERRRYWYNRYGIYREQWLSNQWTLAGVADDPDWIPEWLGQ